MAWRRFKLGDICDIIKGVASAANEIPGEFPLVVTAEERKTSQHFQFEGEAVCIPLVSSTGHGNAAINRLHYQAGKFAVASILAAVVPKTGNISCKFLFYYLTALKDRILVPLMKGTSNVSLTVKKLNGLEISIPSLDEQERIVLRLDYVHSKLKDRQNELEAVERQTTTMLANAFHELIDGVEYVPLYKVAPLKRRPVDVRPDVEYPELGARSFGRGLFHKPNLVGAEITWQKLFWIHRGDLVFSNIKAWEGAFGVAGENDHLRVGSHRYLTCVPKPNAISSNFLWYYLQSREGLEKIGAASPGSADRNRTLGQKALMAIEVPVPSLKVQQHFASLHALVEQVRSIRASTAEDADSLIPAMLHEIFGRQANAREVDSATSASNVVQLSTKQKAESDTQLKEAVLVGAIVKAFHENDHQPIGNFRLQKAVYFARRQMGESALDKDYLRKAAGPYNPKMRYSGGIKIATDKNWIKRATGKYGEGNALGDAATEMDGWIERYQFAPAAAWVRDRFKYKSNDLWETLATIDYAMLALKHEDIRPTSAAVLSYIAADDEWRPKIEKLRLTEVSIQNVMVELESLLPDTGG
ncbi:restriction endonuclease subunit S [Agrobacterium sp. S2/73]|uniref:restriction endonuclease subunit S n=1 Tax=unclassified Agrobacterium TaxID=2632611 RepID=UPI001ADCCE68|nr:restriction endonuclease subunit S [Agrobacterium sp. S7/73]MBO9109995.1 restriction endonuclease subunit S [Agrobacterium sp. S2/73]QXZ73954.1 restriction endonuclease subunit S [Agrobacterium sp. S7/73]